jgi:Tfp pilus assembly ATPase PilU
LILEGTRIGEIRDFIAGGRDQYGMQTFDQCLTDLVTSGEVTFDTAKAAATNPSDFELKMKMFSRVAQPAPKAPASAPQATTPAQPETPQLQGMQVGGLDFLSS